MAVKNRVFPLELQSIDSSTLTANYQAVEASGIEAPAFVIRISNNSDEDVTISFDGSTDHEIVAAGEGIRWDFQTNARPQTNIAALAQGTVIYAKGTAGTGTITISGWYQELS